jgi:putative toxin-antitoxin system antitoxin component (TIGR02293 family)
MAQSIKSPATARRRSSGADHAEHPRVDDAGNDPLTDAAASRRPEIAGGTPGAMEWPVPGLHAYAAPVVEQLQNIGFSRAEIHHIIAPRRTLERRVELGEPLAPHEVDRAERLKRVHEMAVRVFGDGEKVARWLRKPSRPLEGRTPVALLETESGAYEVMELLHAIDQGVYL